LFLKQRSQTGQKLLCSQIITDQRTKNQAPSRMGRGAQGGIRIVETPNEQGKGQGLGESRPRRLSAATPGRAILLLGPFFSFQSFFFLLWLNAISHLLRNEHKWSLSTIDTLITFN
jgi:hypothetical protein